MVNGYAGMYGSEPPSQKTSLEMTTEESLETQNDLRDEQPREEDQQPQAADGSQNSGGWWSSLGDTDTAPTPTTAFHHIANIRESEEGFISLMDDPMIPNVMAPSRHKVEDIFGDDADDLGLGNSTRGKTQDEPAGGAEDKPPAAPVQAPTKEDEKRGKSH